MRARRSLRQWGSIWIDEFYVAELVGRGWADWRSRAHDPVRPGVLLGGIQAPIPGSLDGALGSRGIDVKPGFPQLVEFLRSHRIPIAVATPTHAADAADSLRAAGITERFDAFVTGDQVTRGKPDPEIYVTAADRLGVVPQSCLALEDSSAGVLAASRAGMTTLLIPDNGRMPTLEASNAAFRFSNRCMTPGSSCPTG